MTNHWFLWSSGGGDGRNLQNPSAMMYDGASDAAKASKDEKVLNKDFLMWKQENEQQIKTHL